jgi:hypothetical protein
MRFDDPTANVNFGGKRSAAEILVDIADAATIFRAADGETAFATFGVNHTHSETWAVRSKGFRRWLVGAFYKQEGKPPGGQAVADALGVLEARAQYGGAVHPVHIRVAGDDRAIYLDLANETWQAVEVTAAGWRVMSEAPVKFRRARGMLPLPRPVRGGTVDQLRQFVNVAKPEQWALLLAWLVAALRPSGPYPVLALLGEQGTAKSTTQEVFRALVDPNVAPLRAEPRDIRDVMIAASNGWFVAFDNLSDIEPWLSDTLCRLATGGGFSTRELYSDDDERIFVAMRPTMVNGIDAVISRADLLDRTLIVDLPRIPSSQRRQRQAFWRAFEAAHPLILGALLDAVAGALQRHPAITLPNLPRMADFASWAVAAESGLGCEEGAFLAAYQGNRAQAHDLALEASPIAGAIQTLAAREPWKGTAAELLTELGGLAAEALKKGKTWPTTYRQLGSALRRVAPSLREVGVLVEFSDETTRGASRRQIAIRTDPDFVVPVVLVVPERSGSVPEQSGNNAETRVRTAENNQNNEISFRSDR